MYFDFEDYRPDITPVGQVISWREGVLLSLVLHMGILIIVLAFPQWFQSDPRQAEAVVAELNRPEDNPRFVVVDPKVDLEALRAPNLAPLSDKNRESRSPEPVLKPENPLPAIRGNTPEPVEQRQPEIARGSGPDQNPAVAQPDVTAPPAASTSVQQPRLPESQSAMALPPNSQPASSSPRTAGGGSLGNALRNLDRYVKNEQFDNSKGGAQVGPFQFDSKGVDFGPWLVRFKNQVQRNWEPLIPMGPRMLGEEGVVVVTLNIHKNGSISDVSVVGPCPIEGYNSAAYGAFLASNPTAPLPAEYPDDRLFLTATFYYLGRPGPQGR